MQYRKLGRAKDELSAIGYGCMRFPTNEAGEIKEKEAIELLRYAIDNGINYIDTAWPYHKETSENLVGKALQDGYREKIFLATKMPSWLIKSKEDMEKYLDLQLKKLNTDYIDYYLVHALNKDYWKNLSDLDVFAFLDEKIKEGKIRHVGFSFHDEISLFKEIVDAYDWTFCQIQYNYLNEDYRAGKEGLKYAKDKGLGVIIMEPLLGGKLTKRIPKDINDIWDEANKKKTPAEWAFRWLWDQEEVGVILSGMGTLDQVKENILIASDAYPNHLEDKEKALIERVSKKYFEKIKYGCTECEYCMPCPKNVNIPALIDIYNSEFMFEEDNKERYFNLLSREMGPDKCIECGICEEKCPQNLPIRDALKKIELYYKDKK